jgi:GT2 family glycosyltransferase
MMKLAAVLIHYGDPQFTRDRLFTLENSEAVSEIVTILHDEFAFQSEYSRTKFISAPNNGYGAGINCAMRYLSDKNPDVTHGLILNPDVLIDDAAIQSLIAEHKRSTADCTFPIIKEGKIAIHGYRLNKMGLLRLSEDDAQFYSGACFLVSIEAWKKAGEFNEDYFHYFEDIDFCLKLQRAGLRTHLAKSVVLNHIGKSREDYPSTDFPRLAVRNHLRFLKDVDKLNWTTYFFVTGAHLLYLFRWKRGWRGIKAWMKGIQEYRNQ